MRHQTRILLLLAVLTTPALTALAQNAPAPAPKRATLVFRETFKGPQPGRERSTALKATDVDNPNVQMTLLGPGANAKADHESGLLMNQGDDEAKPGTNMSFIWSGVTEGNWAVMLKDKNNMLDLTGPAKIRWRTRPRSFHVLRPLVKLADGTIYIADYGEPGSTYWRETEFFLEDIPRWRAMNPQTADMMRGANWKKEIDLSKVDEIGFTDLSGGAGHGAEGNSAIDWLEVYGTPIKR
jgi:hypothetical protein